MHQLTGPDDARRMVKHLGGPGRRLLSKPTLNITRAELRAAVKKRTSAA